MQTLVKRTASAKLPTKYGMFEMAAYEDSQGGNHLALVKGNLKGNVLGRVH